MNELSPPLMQKLVQARQLISQNRFDEAMRVNAELLAQAPDHPAVLVQASRLAGQAGQQRRGRELARKAFDGRAGGQVDLALLVSRLQTYYLHEEVLQVVDEIEARNVRDIRLLDLVATSLIQMDQPARAHALVERALAISPGHPELLVTRAQTRVFKADFEGAEDDLAQLLRQRPGDGFAWWLRTRLPGKAPPAHIDAIEALLRQPQAGNPMNTVFLAYALHRALDGVGEYARAAAAMDLANRTRRAMVDFDPAEDEELFRRLQSVPLGEPVGPRGGRRPIFVVGMHRSGTTLLEQLLSAHPDVRGLGEVFDFPNQMREAVDHASVGAMDLELAARLPSLDYAAVGAGYLRAVEWRLGEERCFTDKLPGNYYHVGAIAQALPDARILLLVRDPMEVCFSNLREYFSDRTNRHSYDQVEMARHYLGFAGLMAHWRRVLPGRILDVGYSRLVSDTEAVMREVAAFCGLDFDPAMLSPTENRRAVTTASAVQVRQGVVKREKAKWVPYADHLAPLADALSRAGIKP